MHTLVVAEKPSVARDIARVLGAKDRGEGCLSGSGYVVSWAIGHLVTLVSCLIFFLLHKKTADIPSAV